MLNYFHDIQKIHLFSLSKKIKKAKNKITIKNHEGLMTQIMRKKLKNTIHLRYKKECQTVPQWRKIIIEMTCKYLYVKINKRIKNKIKNKKILEVGCGSEYFKIIKNERWKCIWYRAWY